MWLETWQNDKAAMEKDLVESEQLLTKEEWDFLADTPSRCTHIYQWMNNILHDLLERGFIRHASLLKTMHEQLDAMRGANVWGLPSLPLPYVIVVTFMVKVHLISFGVMHGGKMKTAFIELSSMSVDEATVDPVMRLCVHHIDICFHNLFYQGLLDLHGILYNPNQGMLLGHLPVLNFLGFVKTVSYDLIHKSQCQLETLPYKSCTKL